MYRLNCAMVSLQCSAHSITWRKNPPCLFCKVMDAHTCGNNYLMAWSADLIQGAVLTRFKIDAVDKKRGIGIFEIQERSLFAIIMIIMFLPMGAFILTPLIRPLKWDRLFWTYVIPIVPLLLVIDGKRWIFFRSLRILLWLRIKSVSAEY